jgi:3-oxoacyl-[acyl-carrier-protein] synthase III
VTAAVVAGIGGALPPRVVTNDELAAVLDTTDAWIRSRTGIVTRHVVDSGTRTSDLAADAGRRALRSAGTDRADAVVVATSTPDRSCPAVAPDVASRLGLTGVPAFDVAAVCTGFVYALATGAGLIATGVAASVLVIGADTFSTIMDPADRTNRAIFGDGAGAVLLRAGSAEEPGALLGIELGSDGALSELIEVPAGESWFRMQGRSVFLHAVERMAEAAQASLKHAGWTGDDVATLVAHQANLRILHAVAEQLALPRERLAVHLDRVGNTVAASIPLALADSVARGATRPGDRVLLVGFGGGLTWGAACMTWPDLTDYQGGAR